MSMLASSFPKVTRQQGLQAQTCPSLKSYFEIPQPTDLCVLARILAYQVGSALNPLHLPGVLRNLRGILFPNNAPGTTSLFAPSSEDELRALRRRAATSLGGLLPQTVGRLYFGGRLSRQTAAEAGAHAGAGEKRRDDDDHDVIVDGIEALLMILSDEYCNKHLMYGILELVMVRLLPELAEKGVVELMDERLG